MMMLSVLLIPVCTHAQEQEKSIEILLAGEEHYTEACDQRNAVYYKQAMNKELLIGLEGLDFERDLADQGLEGVKNSLGINWFNSLKNAEYFFGLEDQNLDYFIRYQIITFAIRELVTKETFDPTARNTNENVLYDSIFSDFEHLMLEDPDFTILFFKTFKEITMQDDIYNKFGGRIRTVIPHTYYEDELKELTDIEVFKDPTARDALNIGKIYSLLFERLPIIEIMDRFDGEYSQELVRTNGSTNRKERFFNQYQLKKLKNINQNFPNIHDGFYESGLDKVERILENRNIYNLPDSREMIYYMVTLRNKLWVQYLKKQINLLKTKGEGIPKIVLVIGSAHVEDMKEEVEKEFKSTVTVQTEYCE